MSRKWSRPIYPCALLLLSVAYTSVLALPKTYHVRTDGAPSCNGEGDAPGPGPGNCAKNKIQDAYDLTVAGDTVLVHHGVYYEQLNFNHQVSPPGPPITVEGAAETPDKLYYDRPVVVEVGATLGHDFNNSDWTSVQGTTGEWVSNFTFTTPIGTPTPDDFAEEGRVYGFVLSPALGKSTENKYWPLVPYVNPGVSNCHTGGANVGAWRFLEANDDDYETGPHRSTPVPEHGRRELATVCRVAPRASAPPRLGRARRHPSVVVVRVGEQIASASGRISPCTAQDAATCVPYRSTWWTPATFSTRARRTRCCSTSRSPDGRAASPSPAATTW